MSEKTRSSPQRRDRRQQRGRQGCPQWSGRCHFRRGTSRSSRWRELRGWLTPSCGEGEPRAGGPVCGACSCFPRCLSESRRSCAQTWFSRCSSGSWRTPASCPHAGLKSPAHTDGRGNVNRSLGKDRPQNGRWPVFPRASVGESQVVVPCAWTPAWARVPQPERAAALGARWGWASRLWDPSTGREDQNQIRCAVMASPVCVRVLWDPVPAFVSFTTRT